ncbi:MAG: Hsp70 family protein [Desulfobacterales bacterium]
MEPDKRYVIGIDLGTTNSAVSYVDLSQDSRKQKIRLFKVPQLTGPGEITRLHVLPSFLYIPGAYDISADSIQMPWQSEKRADRNFVGAFARDHGAKVSARLVSSAKSWLCHSNVDRKARILPWGAGEEVYKVSPVQATAAYLEHIKVVWNAEMATEEEDYLENQILTVTVPASFDEVARDLTLEAAAMAGFRNVTLLEEPLAAFYSWLIAHGDQWSRHVRPNELILVCDVGGGTTDFTLITLQKFEGSPRFERIAVGDHLILGGDNMDLALARQIESQFSHRKMSLNTDRWKALCHQCRQAKEAILSGHEQSHKITLMGEGSQLIASTIAAKLDRNQVEKTIVEGFFPIADPGEVRKKSARSGIAEFGLPYEPEPAITRHLGWFLERHKEDVQKFLGRNNPAPDLILFNGGALKPASVQERIRASIRHWFGITNDEVPRVLENPDPDLAVALGASYYGLVKIGKGVRVGCGSARAYFLGISIRDEQTGTVGTGKAICLVERGLDEGTHIELGDYKFEVLANQPVAFNVYSSSYRSGDRCGDIVTIDDTMVALPPLQTVVQFGKKGVQKQVPVQIEADFTEIGTLAVWCRSLISNHRWQLQFRLRDEPAPAEVSDTEIFDETIVAEALDKIESAFSNKTDTSPLNSLTKEIADVVERPREKWPLGLIRKLADTLLKHRPLKNISPVHESRWLNLTGFCMRPGFAEGFDPQRMTKLWKIYPEGMRFSKNAQVRSEWWILWRRTAGGLKPGQQRQFSQDLTPVLMPGKGAKIKISPQERLEIWMALANMELLHVKDKIKWGRQLLSEMSVQSARPQHFWSISRFGARSLLYGPADRVVPPEEVSRWIDTLLKTSWPNPKPVGMALAQMARKTGDRIRDVDEALIEKIFEWMDQDKFFGPHQRYLKQIIPMQRQEQSTIFGESLPAGLVMGIGD